MFEKYFIQYSHVTVWSVEMIRPYFLENENGNDIIMRKFQYYDTISEFLCLEINDLDVEDKLTTRSGDVLRYQ